MLKNAQNDFIQRHIGPSVEEQNTMLKELGYKNLDELIKDTVPEKILLKDNLETVSYTHLTLPTKRIV